MEEEILISAFKEIKKSFPEVRSRLVGPTQIKFLMLSDVLYTGNIFYSGEMLDEEFSELQLAGLLAHELSHQVNQSEMRDYTKREKIKHEERYNSDTGYRRFIERNADRTTVRRGFGQGLYSLMEKFYLDLDWKRKYAREHLSLREIRKLMKK
jgi:hypothetical protein